MKHVLLVSLKTIPFMVLKCSLPPCLPPPSPIAECHWLAQDKTKSYSVSLHWPYFGLFLHLLFLPTSLRSCDVSRTSIVVPLSQMKKLRPRSLSRVQSWVECRPRAGVAPGLQQHTDPGPLQALIFRFPGGRSSVATGQPPRFSLPCDRSPSVCSRTDKSQETH